MKKAIFPLVFTLIAIHSVKAQTIEELFAPKMPDKVDTIYYLFNNGVQLIEVNHIGYWDRKIFFLEQSEPRAMPHSMFHPQPMGNEIFFRDTSGKIIKAFNSAHNLEGLNKVFKNIPLNYRSSTFAQAFFPYHSQRSAWSGQIWPYSVTSMYNFNGLYKVYADSVCAPMFHSHYQVKNPVPVRFGLIDSLGEFVIPMIYRAILPLGDQLLVNKDSLWGVIDRNNKVLVPFKYDSYDNYYVDHEEQNILFKKGKKIVLAYSHLKKESYKIDGLEGIHSVRSLDEVGFTLVRKNKKWGVMKRGFNQVLPCKYDQITMNLEKGYFRVEKDDTFGLVDTNGRVLIPIKYEKISWIISNKRLWFMENGLYGYMTPKEKVLIPAKYHYATDYHNGRAMVREQRYWSIIDLEGKALVPFEYQSMRLFRKKYYRVQKEQKFGLLDRNGKEIIPCIYDNLYVDYEENKEADIKVRLKGRDEYIKMP